MPGRIAVLLLSLEGVVLLSLGIRETLAGSWIGMLLAWSLAVLALVNTWVLAGRRG